MIRISLDKLREIAQLSVNAAEEGRVRGLLTESRDIMPTKAGNAIHAFLQSLTREEQADVIALFWLGRADFENFATARAATARLLDDGLITYICGKRIHENLASGVHRLLSEDI